MKDYRFQALLPLFSFPFEGATIITRRSEVLAILLDPNSDFSFPFGDYGREKVHISRKDVNRNTDLIECCLVFELHIAIDPDAHPVTETIDKGAPTQMSEPDASVMRREILREMFHKALFDLLVITQICYPGTLEFNDGELRINDNLFPPLPPFSGHLTQALLEQKDSLWPPIEKLDLFSTLKFFETPHGILPPRSTGNVERAAAAFSHLFQYRDSMELTLLWCMVGLEALYTKEPAGIMEQVREKIALFLGDEPTARKKISGMYAHRSKFIHGSMEVPSNRYGILFTDSRISDYSNETWDVVCLSIRLLLSSVQKAIGQNKKTLSFGYVVN